jgi:hypothetical protein
MGWNMNNKALSVFERALSPGKIIGSDADLVGQLVSWLGTEVSGIALPLVVLALTGSPAQG